jgi:hypothetical protein
MEYSKIKIFKDYSCEPRIDIIKLNNNYMLMVEHKPFNKLKTSFSLN